MSACSPKSQQSIVSLPAHFPKTSLEEPASISAKMYGMHLINLEGGVGPEMLLKFTWEPEK